MWQNYSAHATKRVSECGPSAGGGTASSSPLGLSSRFQAATVTLKPRHSLSLQVRYNHLAGRCSAVLGSATCPRLLVRQNCSAHATKRVSECGPSAGGGTASSSPLGLSSCFQAATATLQPRPSLSLQVRYNHLAGRCSAVVGSATCPRLLVRQNCSAHATKRVSQCGPSAGGGAASSFPLGLSSCFQAATATLQPRPSLSLQVRYNHLAGRCSAVLGSATCPRLLVRQNCSAHATKRVSECGPSAGGGTASSSPLGLSSRFQAATATPNTRPSLSLQVRCNHLAVCFSAVAASSL